MKTKTFLFAALFAAAAVFVINGCKKESTPATDSDVTAAQDESNASFAVQDSKNIADGAAKNQAVARVGLDTSMTWRRIVDTNITINNVQYTTDTGYVIYFPGTHAGPDGRTRKGYMFVFWKNGGYFQNGSVVSQLFSPNYPYSITMLNGNTITLTGYRQTTNQGIDTGNGDMTWGFSASLTLVYSGNAQGTATWQSTRTNTLTWQGNNLGWFYSITGSANGVTRNGVSFTINILQPLMHTAYWLNTFFGKPTCQCFESGEVEIQRTGKQYPLYLTFTSGLGNCSCSATASINNKSYNVILP
ncbi:MAG: hypothetical protein HKL88_06275 [Bacteroidia bacterium]|jgi:hypothetical protein|nr:hypothetical protein [Bacteroidia bacterium]